jgi:nucleotide-binding universal stress UspA family protein
MKVLMASSGLYEDETEDPALSALSFPWPKGSEIHVVSVAEVMYPVVVGMAPDAVETTDVEVRTEAEAGAAANRIAMQFRSLGFSAEGIAMRGNPETSVLEHAKEWGADLIVVGSRERSRVEKFLTGSISESIVRNAPCSVLLLRHAG